MQGLPNFVILDFLEFINKNDFDLLDLFFDKRYDQILHQEAKSYCCLVNSGDHVPITKTRIKEYLKFIVNSFCESYDFERFYRHLRYEPNENYLFQSDVCRVLEGEFHHYLWHNKEFGRFWDNTFNSKVISEIYEDQLIDNVRYYLKRGDNQELLSFLVESSSVEIDFLEWLEKKYSNEKVFPKIDLMPVDTFKEFAYTFACETGRDRRSVNKLVHLFIDSDDSTLKNKLRSIFLPYAQKNNKKKLVDIARRYFEQKGLYKCVILPLENDQEYKNLISNHWNDLNIRSGNSLDIYYCYTDYGKSGYELMEELNYLPEKLEDNLPCILLWKDNMDKAGIIPIRRLNSVDIFFTIDEIVKNIKSGLEFDEIVRRTNKMNEERNAKSVTNTIHNYGNMGSAVIGDNAKVEVTFNANDINQLSRDVQEAHRIINESSELNEKQKEKLCDIVSEAQKGVEENSESKIENSKQRLKDFIDLVGNVANKVVSALSEIKTIGKLFGIG